jgi:hypothetical protein
VSEPAETAAAREAARAKAEEWLFPGGYTDAKQRDQIADEIVAAFVSEMRRSGYAVVPREATPEMVQAGIAAWLGAQKFEDDEEKLFYEVRAFVNALSLYAAMIEAAPSETGRKG